MTSATKLRLTLATLIITGGCASAPKRPVIETVVRERYSPNRTIALGAETDLNHHRAIGAGLADIPSLNGHLQRIAARLAGHSPVTGIPISVGILASRGWGAHVTPDANIFVSLGLAEALENEDEAAGLLAHELAHIVLKHTNSDQYREMQTEALRWSTALASVRDAVARSDKDSAKIATRAVDIQRVLLEANTIVVSPAWTREQEVEADLLAADMMLAAGYNPEGLVGLLNKLAVAEEARRISYRTVDIVYQTAESWRQVQEGADLDVWEQTTRYIAAGFDVLERFRKNHPSIDDRLNSLSEYMTRFHMDQPWPDLEVEPWKSRKEEAQPIFDNYRLAAQAEGYLAKDNIDKAASTGMKAIRSPTGDHTYPRWVMSRIRRRQGKLSTSRQNLEKILGSREPSMLAYIELSDILLLKGDDEGAVRVLEDGYARLDEPPTAMPDLIRTYKAVSRDTDAQMLAGKCSLHFKDDEQASEKCRDALVFKPMNAGK